MIRAVRFNFNGDIYALFIDETTTGYTGKDVLTKPGVYEELTTLGYTFPIAELDGSIEGYSTKLMGLIAVADQDSEKPAQLEDCTEHVKRVLTIPETAAKMLMSQSTEDIKDLLENAMEVIHFYESVTADTKVFLPEEAFKFVEPEVAKRMRSTRQVFVLKTIDNQEIVQANCESEYGIVLPHVQELHGVQDAHPNSMDVLRVCAPYRKEVAAGVFQYSSIYHTPYYRVDPKMRGFVPQHLSGINGYAKNDLLGIQKNEWHMYNNLYMFLKSDAATYVNEICTGIFLNTRFGKKLKMLLSCKNQELLPELTSDIANTGVDGVKCDITYSDVQATIEAGMTLENLVRLVVEHLDVSAEAMERIIVDNVAVNRIVDIENLYFTITFDDDEKERLTEVINSHHVLTSAAFNYVVELCCKAYDVNWGHTGATRAVPRLVSSVAAKTIDEAMRQWLGEKVGNTPMPATADISKLYPPILNKPSGQDFEFEFDSDSDEEDELLSQFDYYITAETVQKIRANALSLEFFSGGVTGAETTEAGIVEYWRKVNGDNNLIYFITSAFTSSGEIEVLLQAFYKLMRWGDRKPSLLVFTEYPNIKTVFDLNLGKEIPNTAIVDESQLVMVNGCKHTMAGVLTASGVLPGERAIVGFLLCKDYGVKKYVMMSWSDIGEMVSKNEVDIAEFKGVAQIQIADDAATDMVAAGNSGYQLYTSLHNIEQGLNLSIQPEQLSELALLSIPGILDSAEYLRSKQSKMLVTTKDRQYSILSSYVNAIRSLYGVEGQKLRGESISTIDLSAMALRVYQEMIDGEKTRAPEANAVRSKQAIASMVLDTDDTVIDYSTTPLSGKFCFITDVEQQSVFQPIVFSDPQVAEVSRKPGARFVLLLLETDTELLLCRKDITAGEVKIDNGRIACKRYSVFAKGVDALTQGRNVTSKTADGTVKQVKLHESLKEFLS